jgi:hypothetical protein
MIAGSVWRPAVVESILWAGGLVCVLIYAKLLGEAFKVLED